MQHSADGDSDRFRSGAGKYAAYLETPEGRLRLDLAFANLQDFLPQPTASLRALDLGCGTGAMGVRLARLGVHVTLLDSSLPMLNFAERAAGQAGVSDRIALQHGDAAQLSSVIPEGSFDVVVCHNLLEYAKDPAAVLRGAARALRDRCAIISILVRNHAGEVLKSAIQGGDLAAAEQNLAADWAHESLYGGKVRLFTPESLGRILASASLGIAAERGVRVVSDYLPPQLRSTEYARVLDLECKLGRRPEFAAIARYRQCLARRAEAAIEDCA